jgi:biotin carboxyl carrier protein
MESIKALACPFINHRSLNDANTASREVVANICPADKLRHFGRVIVVPNRVLHQVLRAMTLVSDRTGRSVAVNVETIGNVRALTGWSEVMIDNSISLKVSREISLNSDANRIAKIRPASSTDQRAWHLSKNLVRRGVMADIFEYDVFLSFLSSDEEIVKPIWQELCLSGLRVFWSDASLKKEVGNSWFEVIQSSLERSRHLLLFCSSASMASEWVQREYKAFLNNCYKPRFRRLVPILLKGYKATDLPLFLRDIEAWRLDGATSMKEIVSILGGVDIEELRSENQFLKQTLETMSQEKASLEEELNRFHKQLKSHDNPHKLDVKLQSSTSLRANPEVADFEREKEEAFKFLGLPLEATSQDIGQRYATLKREYEALIINSPKALSDICESRLLILENAFWSVFFDRKAEEDQKVERAFEILQVSKEANRQEIEKRISELKAVCLRAMESSDTIIKEAAAKELEKLEEAFSMLNRSGVLVPHTTPDESEELIDVVVPQMGESIPEATITKWLKREGEQISRDEPLFEISTDKVDAEIPSPATGILSEILTDVGETVPVNQVVALILPVKASNEIIRVLHRDK